MVRLQNSWQMGAHPSRCLILGKQSRENREVSWNYLFLVRDMLVRSPAAGWAGKVQAFQLSLTEAPFLVGPPSTLSFALCPPCLAWQPAFHLCLQASSYGCSLGRASGWLGLRGASCSILYNNLLIPPNSKNLTMLLRRGELWGVRIPISGATAMPELALRVRASLDYPDMVVHTHSPKIWEAEAGGYLVSSRPAVLWSETLSQKTKVKRKDDRQLHCWIWLLPILASCICMPWGMCSSVEACASAWESYCM